MNPIRDLEPALPEKDLTAARAQFQGYKKAVHEQLVRGMNVAALAALNQDDLRREVRRAAEDICRYSTDLLSRSDRDRLVNEVLDETFGLGPLEPLMRDPAVTDILINGPKTVYIERQGQLELTDVTFLDNQHLLQIVQRIVGRMGRRVDETSPMVDARLPDGSRFNAIIPPLALDGPCVSIRRFSTQPLTMSDLVHKGALTQEMTQFLNACVTARQNMIISGGTGSGKTTLLGALSAYIPAGERVATIEDAAELQLQRRHVVRMETRPRSVEGTGEVVTRDLVRNVLRMRPDRIIIGECRGPEALDMLQAMNTGHEGSLTTIHANDTRDALDRLEIMIGMAGFDLPLWIIRRQIASAIRLIVQTVRLAGGPRKVVKISEVTGLEHDIVQVQDLFIFKQTGLDEKGMAQGEFWATGQRPRCLDRLHAVNADLPEDFFIERVLER